MKIAFLGIGLMGRPMVGNLIKAGFDLNLWNRTRSKVEEFAQYASVFEQPCDAVVDADVVITMLENGDVVDEVLFQRGVADGCRSGTIIMDMSSIPPSLARQHHSLLDQRHVLHLDAPVSGGTVGAEQATLSIMVGGNQAVFDQALPILNILGSPLLIGPTGSGQLAKLANQAIVGITIGAVAEALLLASSGGADPAAVRQALMGGFASSRILDLHGQRMIDRDFAPGATSRVQLKDMRSILDEAQLEGLTLPLSQRTYESYLSLVANGHENDDHSGLLLELERLNQQVLTSQ